MSQKPLQLMTQNDKVRSIHGVSYTRIFDADLLELEIDKADDFQPPPQGINGATGLYAGEQDMFALMIDDRARVDRHIAVFDVWRASRSNAVK